MHFISHIFLTLSLKGKKKLLEMGDRIMKILLFINYKTIIQILEISIDLVTGMITGHKSLY